MTDTRDALQAALKTAMKEKNAQERTVIRSLTAAIKQVEIDTQTTLDEAGVVDVINKDAKKRRDAIDEMRGAGRDDLADSEQTELEIVMRFLPKQMTREEIEAVVSETIAEVGATNPKEMGKVMGALMPKVKGKADGKLVNEVVREQLNN